MTGLVSFQVEGFLEDENIFKVFKLSKMSVMMKVPLTDGHNLFSCYIKVP